LFSENTFSIPFNALHIFFVGIELNFDGCLRILEGALVGIGIVNLKNDSECLNVYHISEGDNIYPQCFGFGIVWNINYTDEIIHITTPIHIDLVKQANCIIKGAMECPPILSWNPKSFIFPTNFSNLSLSNGIGTSEMKSRRNIQRGKSHVHLQS
jgi:hypothetical protein